MILMRGTIEMVSTLELRLDRQTRSEENQKTEFEPLFSLVKKFQIPFPLCPVPEYELYTSFRINPHFLNT